MEDSVARIKQVETKTEEQTVHAEDTTVKQSNTIHLKVDPCTAIADASRSGLGVNACRQLIERPSTIQHILRSRQLQVLSPDALKPSTPMREVTFVQRTFDSASEMAGLIEDVVQL